MSAHTVDYILRILDQGSKPLKQVSTASKTTASGLAVVSRQNKNLESTTKSVTGSVEGLRRKLRDLRSHKELIDPKNLNLLKNTNREIQGLEKQLGKLDKVGSRKGGGLKQYLSEMGGLGRFATNPLTIASAAIGFSGKSAASFDEGMAKINVTAQLDPDARAQLAKDIKDIAKKNKFDVAEAPDAFEQIISQVEDVELTKSIFDQTLKGAKAGFTDVNVVAGALAQSLSIIGKENATAQEVLDTLFASKRVGAGEFTHFATYMPGLIASADALGVKYKEVAGLFGYMTGKGQSPERSAVLLDNMFSQFGRGDVVGEMANQGLKVHDASGQIRPMLEIFKEMSGVMDNMSDAKRSEFLETLGINRLEAKKAFMVMISDTDKLAHAIDDVSNSAGESDRALEFSKNTMQSAGEVWAAFKNILLDFGTELLPVINVGISGLGSILSIVASAVKGVTSFFEGWYSRLKDGNPLVLALTAAMTAAGMLFVAHVVKLKAITVWNFIAEKSTDKFTKAQAMLRASFLSTPWGLALVGITAIAGAMVGLLSKTDNVAKSFAQFNLELQKNNKETKDTFDNATKATLGSKERADAINKINERYGEYLPNLLTEKTTNGELADVLLRVNTALENKLRLKFREEAASGAYNELLNTEKAIYEEVLRGMNTEQAKIASKKTRTLLDQFGQGELNVGQLGLGLRNIRQVAGVLDVKDHLLGNMRYFHQARGYVKSFKNVNTTNTMLDGMFGNSSDKDGSTEPGGNPELGDGGGRSSGSSGSGSGGGSGGGSGSSGSGGGGGGSGGSGSGSGGSSSRNSWLHLDKIDGTNAKGSSIYGAIMSKIGRVRLAGLSPEMSLLGSEMPRLSGDDSEYSAVSRFMSMNKFCDKIEIHIEKADEYGMDQIRNKVIEVLTEVTDGRL